MLLLTILLHISFLFLQDRGRFWTRRSAIPLTEVLVRVWRLDRRLVERRSRRLSCSTCLAPWWGRLIDKASSSPPRAGSSTQHRVDWVRVCEDGTAASATISAASLHASHHPRPSPGACAISVPEASQLRENPPPILLRCTVLAMSRDATMRGPTAACRLPQEAARVPPKETCCRRSRHTHTEHA